MRAWMISLVLLTLAAAVIGFGRLVGDASGIAQGLCALGVAIAIGLVLRARQRAKVRCRWRKSATRTRPCKGA